MNIKKCISEFKELRQWMIRSDEDMMRDFVQMLIWPELDDPISGKESLLGQLLSFCRRDIIRVIPIHYVKHLIFWPVYKKSSDRPNWVVRIVRDVSECTSVNPTMLSNSQISTIWHAYREFADMVTYYFHHNEDITESDRVASLTCLLEYIESNYRQGVI